MTVLGRTGLAMLGIGTWAIGRGSYECGGGPLDDDWRKHDPQYSEPALSANLRVVELLREIRAELGRQPGAVAVAWVLNNRAVSEAVSFRNPGQVAGLAGTGDMGLSAKQLSSLPVATSNRTDGLS
jgi:aryl-alcohol dehydrogenase-like predicted oxidoreductase